MQGPNSLESLARRTMVYGYGEVADKMALLDSTTRRAILFLLAKEGPLTVKELSTKLGLSTSAIFDHMRRLREGGVIERAEEVPKHYKVEVHYRLAVPYFFVSELNALRGGLEGVIREYRALVDRALAALRAQLKKSPLACARGRSEDFLKKAEFALLVNLNSLVMRDVLKEPMVFLVFSDAPI